MVVIKRKFNSLDLILKPEINSIAKKVLAYLGHAESEITIIFTSDDDIKELNHHYRNINETTDVLSFPYDQINPENGRQYLGDIVISTDRAKIQSNDKGWDIMKEVQMLIVHGILHLLDYDHITTNDSKIMFHKQDEIIDFLND